MLWYSQWSFSIRRNDVCVNTDVPLHYLFWFINTSVRIKTLQFLCALFCAIHLGTSSFFYFFFMWFILLIRQNDILHTYNKKVSFHINIFSYNWYYYVKNIISLSTSYIEILSWRTCMQYLDIQKCLQYMKIVSTFILYNAIKIIFIYININNGIVMSSIYCDKLNFQIDIQNLFVRYECLFCFSHIMR